MRDLTVDLLKHLFKYDKETGELRWDVKKAGVTYGAIAGCSNGRGYLVVRVNGNLYYVHRLIFLMHKGYLPKIIDHINGDKLDNRIENLRSATVGQNQHNRKTNTNNTSGYKGVCWDKAMKKWRARIKREDKSTHLGYFTNAEEADKVVRAAREELHGSFANHGDE